MARAQAGDGHSGAARKAKRQRPGDVIEVPLGDGWVTYARARAEASLAFYDARTKAPLPPEDAVRRPVLFTVPVMDRAVKDRRWRVVGTIPLPPDLAGSPRYFMQDELDPSEFSIYEGGVIRPATRQETAGLERMAVWDPEHVEDRLRDHYAGRPCRWVEDLRPTP